MKSHLPTCRTLLTASLFLAGFAGGASAQDLYKSRAEMLKAAALNKQANASIIDAMATYGKTQAEVAKIHQEIREKSAQNDLLESKVYYEKRAQYEAHRAARRAHANSPEQNAERSRRSVRAMPSMYQLGGKPGSLRWPTLLKSAAYAALRRQIDNLLKHRTLEDSGAGSQNCIDTLARVDKLKAELRDNIRRYKPNDYLAARRFLNTVASEAQEPVFSMAKTLDLVAGR